MKMTPELEYSLSLISPDLKGLGRRVAVRSVMLSRAAHAHYKRKIEARFASAAGLPDPIPLSELKWLKDDCEIWAYYCGVRNIQGPNRTQPNHFSQWDLDCGWRVFRTERDCRLHYGTMAKIMEEEKLSAKLPRPVEVPRHILWKGVDRLPSQKLEETFPPDALVFRIPKKDKSVAIRICFLEDDDPQLDTLYTEWLAKGHRVEIVPASTEKAGSVELPFEAQWRFGG